MGTLSRANFFSLIMDASTDKGNVDDEIFLVIYCDVDGCDENGFPLCAKTPSCDWHSTF